MADYGHRLTEYELSKLEQKIEAVYKRAGKDLGKLIAEYFEKFSQLDEEYKQKVEAGEMTEQEYTNWRLNAMARGDQYEAVQDKVAKRMTDANFDARGYVAAAMLGIYVLNRNYSAYTVEKIYNRGKPPRKRVSFALFEESTARRTLAKDRDLMPYYSPAKALDRGIDLKWGKKQIRKIVTSDILQGKSIPKIADDLQERIIGMNRTSAIRAARTAVTCAENAGHMDTYKDAEKKGIAMEKIWIATLDGRTRHSHRVLDGERIGVDDTFSNGCRFPGDSQARPEELYNCRCRLLGVPKGMSIDDAARISRMGDMSYEEWKNVKVK